MNAPAVPSAPVAGGNEPSAPHRCVAVAYSGGRDSTALLHATVAVAREVGASVVALHVHHGLSPGADAWLAHCAAQCARWREEGAPIALRSERLPPADVHAGGTEAWARTLRHAALARMAQAAGASLLLLAHHRQDQAETVVLQALRGGGGVDGWSAMPVQQRRGGIVWARPWLDQPRSAIAAYLADHGLDWIDDDSNGDRRHARNRLRLDVWPALAAAFPQAEASLAAAARRAQDAAACLEELAAIDLATACPGGADQGLVLARWGTLSMPRRSNALRAWLRAVTGRAAPATLIARLLREAGAPADGGGIAAWTLPDGTGSLRRWRGRLHLVAAPMPDAAGAPRPAEGARGAPARPTAATSAPQADRRMAEAQRVAAVAIATVGASTPGFHALPGWGGQLRVTLVTAGGVALERLGQLTLRPRLGGERFQSGPGRPARSLKRQFQAAAVPAWRRTGPLVYDRDGALLYVPGLGVDARAVAAPGEPQALLAWEPRALPGAA